MRRIPVSAAVLAAQLFAVTLVFAATLVFVPTRAECGDKSNQLGDRVATFCKEHRGKRVGNGECTTLVSAALLEAGAKPHGWGDSRRAPPKRGEFNWGELVYTVERNGGNLKWTGNFDDVRRGDILQFRNVVMAGSTDVGTYTAQARHHSAIIYGVDREEGVLKIYHQNYNGRKAVTTDRIRLADLQEGHFDVYHPLPATRNHVEERKAPLDADSDEK